MLITREDLGPTTYPRQELRYTDLLSNVSIHPFSLFNDDRNRAYIYFNNHKERAPRGMRHSISNGHVT